MRVQFWGDASGTGFGTVTRDLGLAMIAAGHDLRFVSQNDLEAELEEPFGTWDADGRVFRVSRDLIDIGAAQEYGLNSLSLTPESVLRLIRGELWGDGWRPEAAIFLGDFLNVRKFVMADADTMAAFAALPTYHYVPIEGVDLPPVWSMMWRIIHPVAMCEAGADEIEKIMGQRPPVVYHGVDTDQFRPVSPEKPLYLATSMGTVKLRTKAECKRFFGYPPQIRWVLRTDRLMPRKRYASWLRALAPVLAERADVVAVMHCRNQDEGSLGGIEDLKTKYTAQVASQMRLTGFHDLYGGAPRDILTALYNAADVYASNSAEGFGLTIAEALACGTPAVGMAYSAVPEVIGPGGLLAPVNRLDDNEYDYAWATVDEPKFGAAVGRLLDNDVERRTLGRAGAAHVRATFQWSTAAQQFGTIMERRMEAVA